MAKYNLTPNQQSLIRELVRTYKSGYDGEFFHKAAIGGGQGVKVFQGKEVWPATTADLVALERAGFIALRRGPHAVLYGTLCGLAYEAEQNNFVAPEPAEAGRTINIGNYITNMLGGNVQGAVGANNTLNQTVDSAELQQHFKEATERLTFALQQVLDSAQWRAAMGEIVEVEQEFATASPSAATVSKATKSLGNRLLAALDFGDKFGGTIQAGIYISEGLVALAAWANIGFQVAHLLAH